MYLLLFLPLLFVGPNYDDNLLGINPLTGNDVHVWASHYPRLFDGTNWINYQWSQSGDLIRFESANIIYEFENCAFRLYDPNDKSLAVNDYKYVMTIDGSEVPTSCTVDNVIPSEDGLTISTMDSSSGVELVTIHELDASGNVEWTYELKNNDLFFSKSLGIKETCTDCIQEETKDDRIKIGSYILDTKNRIHNSLKEITQKGDLELVYEGTPVGFNGKTIIDPIFGWSGGVDSDGLNDSVAGGVCNDATSGVYFGDIIFGGDGGGFCYRGFTQFDISSLSTPIIIQDVDFRFDTSEVGAFDNCDIYHMTVNLATAT